MNVQQAYDVWADSYDTVVNPTRDLEGRALRETLSQRVIQNHPLTVAAMTILEIGCGTGKNTEWLLTHAEHLVATDFSEEMLAQAKSKIAAPNVIFQQMDMREKWAFSDAQFDLIACSLALEHIENIDFVFQEARRVLKKVAISISESCTLLSNIKVQKRDLIPKVAFSFWIVLYIIQVIFFKRVCKMAFIVAT